MPTIENWLTEADIQTSDSVPIRVARIYVDPDSVIRIRPVILAWAAGNHAATWTLEYSFKRDGTETVVQVGSGTKSQHSLADGSNWNVIIVISEDSVEFELTGDALKVVEWGGSLDFFTMPHSP